MNIIIPAAGVGRRFIEDGYSTPKPLINVLGEPMITHVIRSLRPGTRDQIYVVYTQDLEPYLFRSVLRKAFYGLSLHFVLLNFHTRGPAETVLCALNQIPHLEESVLVIDCDTFYREDVLSLAKEQGDNCIFYFEDRSPEPLFSYIQISAGGLVTQIREKVQISLHACTGAYGFRTGELLKEYCEQVLDSELKSNHEYYLSNVYDQMLADGEAVHAVRLDDFVCLGTPQQLKTYCTGQSADPKRFCFDLDGTLVTFPEEPGDYRSVKPVTRNIRFVQYLHEQGHTIIIQTARKMLSSHYNAGQATRAAYRDVFDTLEQYEIPFDEIYFGKPHAHFYIDDLSVKPFDLEREIGFYNTRVEARHFNHIEYRGESVRKTTNNPGEIYWYRHIPDSVRNHFPHAEIRGNHLTLERIDGIEFSYLLINNSLTRANLGNLLETVERLHVSAPVPAEEIDYGANYNAKMADRFRAFDYRPVSRDAECAFHEISDRLAHHAPVAGVIHGDLVFSNIFLCLQQRIRFIDMRGRVGDRETIFGDIFYDYAKIYQSLQGYDFILNDCEINETYLGTLRESFEESFVRTFSTGALQALRSITACLLFSLIPLHEDPEKQQKYFGLIERCL